VNEVLEKRIQSFKDCVEKLEKIHKEGKERFMKDWKLQDSALRNFQVAIESLADIANHIISEKNYERPSGYREIVKVLNKNKVIPNDFFKTATSIMGFRNIIVHEYLYLDMERVYNNLSRIEDLRKFLKYLLNVIRT
jgi:uncharacterized protein YutE (UPF0331/DUF86 family)